MGDIEELEVEMTSMCVYLKSPCHLSERHAAHLVAKNNNNNNNNNNNKLIIIKTRADTFPKEIWTYDDTGDDILFNLYRKRIKQDGTPIIYRERKMVLDAAATTRTTLVVGVGDMVRWDAHVYT